MASSSNGEPSTAPQPNRWYDLRLGASCRDPSPTAKFCTLRCKPPPPPPPPPPAPPLPPRGPRRHEFKPASIDKTQAGSLQSTKDNRVTVEFHNNQPGKPKVTFEGSQEEYKDNDGVLFFDGETFRLERLHRAVKRLRHVRVPGESATANLAATSTGIGAESHSPPLMKVAKSHPMGKPAVHSVPVEVERIDIGEPENPGSRYNNKSTVYQPVTTNPFSISPDPNDQEENLDILGDDDDDNGSPNNMASGQETLSRSFDINLPNKDDMDDEIADVDVNDEADEGLNAAEALRAQVNAEGQQEEPESSSSSGSSSSSSSSGSGSGSGSSSSDSDGSDGDSASSGGDVDI
ncbi:hypothetical protein ACP4OV_010461 [Aristida adscensionis]